MDATLEPIVLALGGNAIIQKGDDGNVYTQWDRTEASMRVIAELIDQDHRFVITHGNGPQVGQIMMMVDKSQGVVPEVPLGVADAMTAGSMGYMIEQCLQNALIERGTFHEVVTVPAQMVVDRRDPAIKHPSKPIGMFFSEQEAKALMEEKGWTMREDAGRGWRRYVASPYPLDIIEKAAIRRLVEAEIVVITGGGGGIPVYFEPNGRIEGIDCVIDKDLASMKIALAVGSRLLVIVTGVPQVVLNYGKDDEQPLGHLTLAEARYYHSEGQFPAGSMGPKIQAAMEFVQASPENRVIITDVVSLPAALAGEGGTILTAY